MNKPALTAIVLGSATVICIFFLIYAFVQKTEADSQRQRADANYKERLQNERTVKLIIAEKDSTIQVLKLKIDSLEKFNK